MLDSKEKISDFLKLSVLCYFQNFKNSYSMESLSEYIKSLIGTEGYVDKNTWELVLTKQPDVIEEEPADETELLVQESTEMLESLYTE